MNTESMGLINLEVSEVSQQHAENIDIVSMLEEVFHDGHRGQSNPTHSPPARPAV